VSEQCRCRGCRFFFSEDLGHTSRAECRVRAPTVVVLMKYNRDGVTYERAESHFPAVHPEMWCGEFEWPETESETPTEAG